MLITFEGPEGSGKTSQICPLATFLRQQGYDIFTTREPGGTLIGDQIRNILMKMDNTAMHPRTELLLFMASRAQLVEKVIKPQLALGTVVLCDRYADSTLAYQGYGHGMDIPTLRTLINFTTAGVKPDLTLLLDIPAEKGLERRLKSREEWNRLDAYTIAFHQRVREGYHQLAKEEPERWAWVNASQDAGAVQADIRQIVLQYIKNFQEKL